MLNKVPAAVKSVVGSKSFKVTAIAVTVAGLAAVAASQGQVLVQAVEASVEK